MRSLLLAKSYLVHLSQAGPLERCARAGVGGEACAATSARDKYLAALSEACHCFSSSVASAVAATLSGDGSKFVSSEEASSSAASSDSLSTAKDVLGVWVTTSGRRSRPASCS